LPDRNVAELLASKVLIRLLL